MTDRVYSVWQSDEDERPNFVTHSDPSNHYKTKEGFNEFQHYSFILEGRPGYSKEQWIIPNLYATKPGDTSVEHWDFYKFSGGFGAFSRHAIEVLQPFFGERFVALPVSLEGNTFFSLRCEMRIDCLDREKSSVTYFEGTKDVMMIEEYVFRKELLRDNMIFAIPQLHLQLFCTGAIPAVVAAATLRGFAFELVDGELV